MNFPKGVVDKKAYLQYQVLAKNPIVGKDKIFDASDGTEINLGWLPHHLTKKIEHLPLDEQEEILQKKDEYFSINNNMTVLKRKAYGLKQGSGTSSMLEVKKDEVIELFGKMFTPQEIIKTINVDWGIDFNSMPMLSKFRTKYKAEIEEKIEKFKAEYSDIRLGIKRGRLEELVYLYNSQKDKYEENKANDSYRLLLQTLESIRKEAEGDRLTIDGKVDVKYEASIQVHLRNEIFKTLNLKEIILARVAARMNVSPIKLIYSLNNSYYKRFSNVLGDFDPEVEGEEMTYPSQMGYDFERIGKAQKQMDKDIEDAIILDEEENAGKSTEKAQDIKSKLLAKLRKKQEKLKGNKKQ